MLMTAANGRCKRQAGCLTWWDTPGRVRHMLGTPDWSLIAGNGRAFGNRCQTILGTRIYEIHENGRVFEWLGQGLGLRV